MIEKTPDRKLNTVQKAPMGDNSEGGASRHLDRAILYRSSPDVRRSAPGAFLLFMRLRLQFLFCNVTVEICVG